MMTETRRRVAAGLLATLAAVVAVTAGSWMVNGGSSLVRASDGVFSVGVDANPVGNTATSLGVFDTCRGVTAGDTFEIDVYVTEVTDLLSWEAYLRYNQVVLRVEDHNLLFQQAHSGNVSDTSEGTPDSDGLHRVGGVDMNASTPGSGASGDGVLVRITLFAIRNGFSSLSIDAIDLNDDGLLDSSNDIGPWLKNASGDLMNDADGNGFFDGPIESAAVSIGGTDSDGDTMPDVCDTDDDGDGILDVTDNCPALFNPGQEDSDGDGAGDVCDPDTDGDGYVDARETTMGSNPHDGTSTPEVCDGIDNDGDLQIDEGYDLDTNGIPDCTDPDADTDGDGTKNPDDADDDDDGFPDSNENYMTTNSLSSCTTSPADDAWPTDPNMDARVDILDVLTFKPPFRAHVGDRDFDRRADLDTSGTINILDILTLKPFFSATCSP